LFHPNVRGVQRVHIIDGTVDGSLLLELFTRDGAGTMIARDVYEGTRMATAEDLPGIRKIIRPLEDSGVLVRRTDTELLEALNSFYVVERDGSIIACAALFPFPEDKSGEVAAIAVSEECRGRGQGDKLLGTFIATWINRICSPLVIAIIYPTPCPHAPVPSFSRAYAILKD